MEALDLLTDFVGRPRIDAGGARQERGVVIQEIQRYKDQPVGRRRGAHRPRRLRRPPARPHRARARGAPAHLHARGDRRLPRAPLVGRARRRVPRRQPRPRARRTARVDELLRPLPRPAPPPTPSSPAPPFAPQKLVEERETNQSHLRMLYRPHIDVARPRRSARRFSIYATLLGGSMGSRLFDEIREQRGLCYSVYAVDHALADVADPAARRRAWTRRSASRPTRACARSSPSCAADGPDARRRSSAPGPTPPAAASWPSRTRTPSRATPPAQQIVFGEDDRPRRGDRGARRA